MPRSLSLLLAILFVSSTGFHASAQPTKNEEVLFFDSTLGTTEAADDGAVILSLESGEWRYWRQGVYHATVSPDGQQVVYREGESILISDPDGQNPQTLATGVGGYGGWSLSWSPQGDRIAYFTSDRSTTELVIMDPNGNILATHEVFNTIQPQPSWSPDGSKVTCLTVGSGGTGTAICVVDVDSGSTTRIYEPSSTTGQTSYNHKAVSSPAWSPKGDKIALALRTEIGTFDGQWISQNSSNIAVVPASGGTATLLTDYPEQSLPTAIDHITWSPDGTELAYSLRDTALLGIHRVPANGGEPTQVSDLFPGVNPRTTRIASGFLAIFQWTVLNPGPQLEINLLPEKPSYEGDEALEVEFKVTHQGEDPATYTFVEDLFTRDPEPEEGEEPILAFGEVETPEPFTLSEENPEWSVTIPAVTKKPGILTLLSKISVQRGEDEPYLLEAEQKILVSPVAAKISITNQEHVLNLTPETEWSEKAQQLNAARRTEELEPYENLIEVKLDVTNAGEDTLENLNIPGALDVLSLIKSIDLENPGVPLTPIQLILPDDSTVDLTEPDNETTIEDIGLQPGEMITFTWLLEAYDVDTDPLVDNSAQLEFKVLILAGLNQETIQTLEVEEFAVVDQPLLEWGVNLVKSGANILSGEPVEVEGYLENISADNGGEGHTLLVALVALTEGNLGGGWMRDPDTSPLGGQFFELFELTPEGENKTKSLKAVFQSLPTIIQNNVELTYEVRLWIKKNEEELEAAHARKKLKSDLQEAFAISLAANSSLFYAQPFQHAVGLPSFLNRFDKESIANFAAAGTGLIHYLFDAKEDLGYLNQSIAAQDFDLKNKAYQALNVDGQELERVLSQGYEHYLTLAGYNILPGGTLLNQSEYIEESKRVIASYVNLTPQEQRALNEIKDDFESYQENLLDLTVPHYIFMNVSRALAEDIANPNSFVYRSLEENGEQLNASLQQRIEDARQNPGIQTITEIFERGDVLKASSLFSTYGMGIYQYRQLQEAAANNDVIISFRSATKVTRQLLEMRAAIPAPHELPLLAVNALDILYLGFEQDEKGKIILLRPPEEILGKTGEALSTAVENYVTQLAATKSELQENVVLLSEVRNRLRARSQEWSSLAVRLLLDEASDSGLIPANFSQTLDSVKGTFRDGARELGAGKFYQFTTEALPDKIDEVTGEARKRWNLFWGDPLDPEDAKPMVNPIEFLPPLDPDGHIIKDEDRLRQIYAQLSSIPGFNHLSIHAEWKDDALAFWRDCCGGEEPVITIAPDGKQLPVVAFFKESLSVLQGGTNASLLQLVPPAGPPGPDILLTSGAAIDAVRRHVSEEFVFLEGARYQAKVDLNYEKTFSPQTWWESLQAYLSPYTPYLPTLLAELLGAEDPEFSRDEDAPIIQPTGEYDEEGNPLLQIWDEMTGWLPISFSEALELGDSGKADFAPMTILPEGGQAGDTQVEITPQEVLGALGDFFQPGDRVVINPGGDNQETTTVRGEGSLIFTTPLEYDHSNGELVAYLGPDETDGDGDGLTGIEEALAGTDSQNADTDGDGINDGLEIEQSQDPLTPLSGFRITGIAAPEGNTFSSLTFNLPANHEYELQASTTLDIEDWLPVERGNTTDLPSSKLSEVYNLFPDSDRIFYRMVLEPE